MEEPVQRAVLLHLPRSTKIDIEFNDISFAVKQGRKEKKQILNGVSGKFKSGELTAIMGPSGAGKTTLLNILTGFQSKGMTGTINSGGSSKKNNGSKQYRKESCYILQDDQLAPFFTVIEIMTMAADLKLGQSLSDKSKLFVIDDILDTLGLMTCKETRCNRLSGGQKKRLSIALELIDNPPIMFLDEPTTGLDSLSSLHCISMLKALARGGRTIVCTIHQPSATSFEQFDHVYVMAAGHCIYQGASQNTVSYLSHMGLFCPEFHNPADYLLEVANGDHGNFTSELATAAKDSKWRSSFTAPLYEIEEERTASDVKTASNKSIVLVNPPSEWNKFIILLNRSLLQLHRDWMVTHLKLVIHIVIGAFIGLFFLNVGNDASQTIPNFSYMLVTCVYLCYTSMMPAVLKFPTELPVLKKERFNNWYNLRTYYFAFMVADIPAQMIFSSAYTAISYFMSSQPQEWSRFFMFLTICMLLTITAESWGFIFGTLVDPINGTFLGAISLAFMIVMAGFLVFFTHMSKFFYIFSFLSYIRFALEGLVYSVYGHDRGTIPCPEERIFCQYTRPDILLKEIGMNHSTFWLSAVVLLGTIIVLRTIAYCTLKNSLSKN